MGPTNASAVYLGVDIGTSGCRCLAVDADGRTLAVAEVCASGAFEPANVRGVGVDGQSWACVPVDAEGTILANTPIWMDTRAQPICDELLGTVPAADILDVAGNRMSPSYTTAKVLWFQRNAPEMFARTRWFLQCNSVG